MRTDGGRDAAALSAASAANDERPIAPQVRDGNTSEQTETAADEQTAWNPSRDWIDEFGRQWTEDVSDRLLGYARHRAAQLRWRGITVDDLYPKDLVLDIVGDVYTGVLAWAPDKISLERLVFRAIRGRTAHHREREQRAPHVPLDTADSVALSEVERALADSDHSSEDERTRDEVVRVVAELRKLARADADVLAYIDALEALHLSSVRMDLPARFGAYRYRRARERFCRLVAEYRASERGHASVRYLSRTS